MVADASTQIVARTGMCTFCRVYASVDARKRETYIVCMHALSKDKIKCVSGNITAHNSYGALYRVCLLI